MQLNISCIVFVLSFILLAGCEEATQALFSCQTAECVEVAVEHGADVNALNMSGRPVLIQAIYSDRPLNVIDRLLRLGADVDAVDVHGWTALMHAAYRNRLDVVNTLIDGGANINALAEADRIHHSSNKAYQHLYLAHSDHRITSDEVTALKIAEIKGFTDIVAALRRAILQ